MLRIDLTGKTFEKLFVLNYMGKDSGGGSLWECVCECGNHIISRYTNLVHGKSKSCGCSTRRKPKNLTGKRFGRLIALYTDGSLYRGKHYIWTCKCDCGNIKKVPGQVLASGHTKSCGCLLNQTDNKVIGKKFNKLLVLEFVGSGHSGRKYRCRCDCGKITIKVGTQIMSGISKSCGCDLYPYENLCGTRFGSWRVLRLAKIQKQRRTWTCKCICGNEKDVMEFSLREGSSKSCGCIGFYESFMATELKKYFRKNYNGIPEYQVCKNPKTNYMLRCDIYLPHHRTFIEIQGDQHYNPKNQFHTDNENSFLYRKSLDVLKKTYAQKHGTYIEIDLRKIKTVEDAIAYIEERI